MKRRIATSLTVLLLASCVTNRWTEPWIEDEQNRGTIEITRTEPGFEYRYQDPHGRLLQLEMRDSEKQLLIGENVVRWKHDGEGRLVEISYHDHLHQRSQGKQGSAIVVIRHGSRNGRRYEIHSHHDDQRNPVMIRAGYFKELVVYDETVPDRVVKRIYFDLDGKLASARVDGIHNTSMIEYSYLLGIGELVYAIHYDPSDSIVVRYKVSGTTFSKTTQSRMQTHDGSMSASGKSTSSGAAMPQSTPTTHGVAAKPRGRDRTPSRGESGKRERGKRSSGRR